MVSKQSWKLGPPITPNCLAGTLRELKELLRSRLGVNGKMVRATGREDVAAPKPVQAGVGLTKTMAPPSELAAESIPFPEAKADFDPFYKNFYHVVRHGAEPIVKNEEVRKRQWN